MLGKLLASIAMTLLIVGCACRDEAASSAEGDPSTPLAQRWQQDPPEEEPPTNVQEQAESDTANSEGEPADDPREPAEDDQREPVKDEPREPTEDEPGELAKDEPREPAKDEAREPAEDDPAEPAESDASEQTENAGDESEAMSSDQEPGVITLRTDDCDAWPSYDWPLEIKVDVPEVPERITKPAPPIEND